MNVAVIGNDAVSSITGACLTQAWNRTSCTDIVKKAAVLYAYAAPHAYLAYSNTKQQGLFTISQIPGFDFIKQELNAPVMFKAGALHNWESPKDHGFYYSGAGRKVVSL